LSFSSAQASEREYVLLVESGVACSISEI
jgi:hypothetical protein